MSTGEGAHRQYQRQRLRNDPPLSSPRPLRAPDQLPVTRAGRCDLREVPRAANIRAVRTTSTRRNTGRRRRLLAQPACRCQLRPSYPTSRSRCKSGRARCGHNYASAPPSVRCEVRWRWSPSFQSARVGNQAMLPRGAQLLARHGTSLRGGDAARRRGPRRSRGSNPGEGSTAATAPSGARRLLGGISTVAAPVAVLPNGKTNIIATISARPRRDPGARARARAGAQRHGADMSAASPRCRAAAVGRPVSHVPGGAGLADRALLPHKI